MPLYLDLAYGAALVPMAPFFAARAVWDARYRHRLSERLGGGARLEGSKIWFHAASVGEINALRPIVAELARGREKLSLAITTMTRAGREAAERLFPQTAVRYLPVDLGPCVRRAIRRLNPVALVLVEQELWPNLILESPCPVAIVNARLSERSFRRYRLVAPLLRRVLRRIRLILAQDAGSRERYVQLGARPESIHETGNVKFDALPRVSPEDRARRANETRARLGIGDSPLLIGGSTHPPEEKILLTAFSRLRAKFPGLRLLLAPRHLDRLSDVETMIAEHRLRHTRLSEAGPEEVIVVDRMGELFHLYAAATVAFVGGSFAPRGGQNIIEPAAWGVPVVTGPGLANFRDVADQMAAAGALRICPTPTSVVPALDEFLSNPDLRTAAGLAGLELVERSRGSAARTAARLASILPREPPPGDPA